MGLQGVGQVSAQRAYLLFCTAENLRVSVPVRASVTFPRGADFCGELRIKLVYFFILIPQFFLVLYGEM